MPIAPINLGVNGAATDWLDASEALSGSVGYHLTGTFSLTITFEMKRIGSQDADAVAVQALNLNTGTAATTATAVGIYVITQCPAGFLCRARVSAYTSGACLVYPSPSLG